MARLTTRSSVDEEALGERFETSARRRGGIYFTPSWLVEQVLDAVAPFVPAQGPVAVVDPACGAGAFLRAAAERFPRAMLFGCELEASSAAQCRVRVSDATIVEGDALRSPALEQVLPREAFELWVGNPPYNGRSALLDDPRAFERMQRLLAPEATLARGQSLRDDFAFFLLLVAERLTNRRGALAFVTSATLLDAFLYAPVRQTLASKLALRKVVDLGAGVFRGTKVRTCFTVWTTDGSGDRVTPKAPQFRLSTVSSEAAALDARWRANGEPLTTLIPVSLPGLKTRFDELLTDAHADRLLERLRELMLTPRDKLAAFAERHGIPPSCAGKLAALPTGLEIEASKVRPFIRYRGSQPRGAAGFCYVDRALIPRGDHRLRGEWDPHAVSCKLVFNVRELPLWAELIDEPGCVTAYQHTRFAPLMVPQRVRDEGPQVGRGGSLEALGPLVPNLSPRGLEWAERVGGPREVFAAVSRLIRSEDVQAVWAPAFGAADELSVAERLDDESTDHHVPSVDEAAGRRAVGADVGEGAAGGQRQVAQLELWD